MTIRAIGGKEDSSIFFGRSDPPHKGTHTINLDQTALLDAPANNGGTTSAQVAGHETLEGYYESLGQSMLDAHDKASAAGLFPGLDLNLMSGPRDTVGNEEGNAENLIFDVPIHGSSVVETVTFHLITPVPLEDARQGKGAPYPMYVTSVEKKKEDKGQ